VSITPADIEAQTFPIAFRGYQVEAVDAFLDRLHEELGRTDAVTSVAPGPDSPVVAEHLPAEDGGSAGRALRTLMRAEQMSEQLLAEANAEADQVRARAQVEAGKVLAGARAESARIEAELHLRHERELGALADQAQQLRAEIHRLYQLERQYHDALQALLSEQQGLLEQRIPVLDAAVAVEVTDATGDLRSVA
jgi:cell division initiation protein